MSYATTPLAWVLVVGITLLLPTGCGGGLEEQQVAAVAANIVRAVPEATWTVAVEEDAGLGPVEVFVDLSKTMAPFAHDRTSTYYQIADRLYNRLGGQIAFYGFGFASGDSAQSIAALPAPAVLLQQRTYDRTNNDYADLFSSFDRFSTTRIILTDGVQSSRGDAGGRAAYARIVEVARQWLRQGGFFAVLMYRSSYDGIYYPESALCTAGAVHYDCERLLLAFVFAPSPRRLSQLLHELGPGLAPLHLIRAGGSDLSLQPLATRALAPSERRAGIPLLRDLMMVPLQNYVPVPKGLVSNQAVDDHGYVSLQFDLALSENTEHWRTLPSEQLRQFLASLSVDVQVWETDPRQDSLQLSTVEIDRQKATIEILDTAARDTVVARLTLPVRKPVGSSARYFAWLLSLRSADGDMLIPDGFSTDTDCTGERCPLTLNLRPLLGAIMRDYTPGRLLFITEWR